MLCIDSPVGKVRIDTAAGQLTGINFVDSVLESEPATGRDGQLERRVAKALERYFSGTRASFDLPWTFGGTDFQRAVWQALTAIPYGETVTYGEIARRIKRPRAVRAVGMACGRNPISIIVPCHRVVGSNGSLTGYGGGLDRKKWLLDLEQRQKQ